MAEYSDCRPWRKCLHETECSNCRLFIYDHINLAQLLFSFIHKKEPKLEWLDVCCGTGRIFRFLGDCFGEGNIPYITYVGYDKDLNVLAQCENEGLKASFDMHKNFLTIKGFVNELYEYVNSHWMAPKRYDRVTLILSLHEIPTVHLPNLILTMFHLCKDNGNVFLFDLEKPRLNTDIKGRENEEGAVYFSREEFKNLIQILEEKFPPAKLIVGKIRYPNYETEGFQFVAPKKIFRNFDKVYADKSERLALELEMLNRMQIILNNIIKRSKDPIPNEPKHEEVFRQYQFKASVEALEIIKFEIEKKRRNF